MEKVKTKQKVQKKTKNLNISKSIIDVNNNSPDKHNVVSKKISKNSVNINVANKELAAEGEIDFANSILNFAKKKFVIFTLKKKMNYILNVKRYQVFLNIMI